MATTLPDQIETICKDAEKKKEQQFREDLKATLDNVIKKYEEQYMANIAATAALSNYIQVKNAMLKRFNHLYDGIYIHGGYVINVDEDGNVIITKADDVYELPHEHN